MSVILLCLGSASTDPKNEDIAKKLDSLISMYHLHGHKHHMGSNFNGVVLAAKSEQVLFKKAYGYANLSWKVKNAIDTKFIIGSVTKTFTSFLIMQLVDEGKLSLTTRLIDVIEGIKISGSEKVTVEHLLSHTSGLPQYGHLMSIDSVVNVLWKQTAESHEIRSFLSDRMNKAEMSFEAGSDFQYNSLNYVLLGLILEGISGLPFETNLKKRVVNPLDLKNTGFAGNKTVLRHLADSYRFRIDSAHHTIDFIKPTYRDRSWEYTSGGVYSTVEDLHRWLIAVNGSELLSSRATELMFTASSHSNYGLGWWINDPRYGSGLNIISHLGAVEGYRANIAMINNNISIVILSNVAPLNLRKLTLEMAEILSDQ